MAGINGVDNNDNNGNIISRLIGFFARATGRKNKSKLPDAGKDEFVRDPSNIINESKNAEAKGLIGQARSFIAQIMQANLDVNPHPVAQIAKWARIQDLALRLVDVIERALQVAVEGIHGEVVAFAVIVPLYHELKLIIPPFNGLIVPDMATGTPLNCDSLLISVVNVP